MTLRFTLREHQRQSNLSLSIRPAQAVERDRRSHLHLIRRDGRGGLFLPSAGRLIHVSAPDAGAMAPLVNPITDPIIDLIQQKGSAA